MSEHTPTPWRVAKRYVEDANILGPDKVVVLGLEDDGACGDPECCGPPSFNVYLRDADAAYIVLCVNSHEALTESNRRLAEIAKDLIAAVVHLNGEYACEKLLTHARAALGGK